MKLETIWQGGVPACFVVAWGIGQKWTSEQERLLMRRYPHEGVTDDLCAALGKNASAVRSNVRRMYLHITSETRSRRGREYGLLARHKNQRTRANGIAWLMRNLEA